MVLDRSAILWQVLMKNVDTPQQGIHSRAIRAQCSVCGVSAMELSGPSPSLASSLGGKSGTTRSFGFGGTRVLFGTSLEVMIGSR